MYRLLLYSFLILPVAASAGTTIYTDSHQRPMSKRKLTAVCSHQTRIGNLDAHLTQTDI
ncbi:hypothetical protein [Escherichia coli]|uniref:hypothetical protein n=1 Tax=Escherichia coli TaxID=562 RepID=UPI0030D1ACBB